MQKEGKFRVVIPKPVEKDFVRLQKRTIERICKGLQRLADDPFPKRGKAIKKLHMEKPIYRLRIGDYRVIYRIQGQNVILLAIVSRKDLEEELKKLK